jgi:hypothetical protein
MVPTMFDNDNKNDTTLTDTKSTKSDAKRSKREDIINLRLECPICFYKWEKNVNPVEDEIGVCPKCLL